MWGARDRDEVRRDGCLMEGSAAELEHVDPPIINALGRRTRDQGLHPPRRVGDSCTCLTHSPGLGPWHLWVPSLVQGRHKALAELS